MSVNGCKSILTFGLIVLQDRDAFATKWRLGLRFSTHNIRYYHLLKLEMHFRIFAVHIYTNSNISVNNARASADLMSNRWCFRAIRNRRRCFETVDTIKLEIFRPMHYITILCDFCSHMAVDQLLSEARYNDISFGEVGLHNVPRFYWVWIGCLSLSF